MKKSFFIFTKIVDLILSIIIILPAIIFFVYRRIGSSKFKLTTRTLKKIGVFPILDHYYEPLFKTETLKTPLNHDRFLPGIDLNESFQLDFLKKLVYSVELIDMKLMDKSSDLSKFSFRNTSFGSGDAEYLYQIIRALKPSKVIEIGSGNSTKIANTALRKNQLELNVEINHLCIEPYEMQWLDQISDLDVIRKPVEDCNIEWETVLSSGDLLFVDSSHIIRPQGDILKEYLEIFPRLATGVYIHIHDIFTPKDYLHTWVHDDIKLWNEQYLLEALLSNTNRYEVVGALNYLKNNHFDKLRNVCPYLTNDREPGSFYIRVK